MGLLSFLKRENERLRAPLKAQAYHATVASNPPIQGTYPIPGGPRPPIRKHVPRRVDTNQPSSPVTGFAPPLPDITEVSSRDTVPERPTTAPGKARSSSRSSRPRSSSRFRRDSRPPPVSFRKPRADAPQHQQEQPEEFHFEQHPVVNPPPRPASSHGRTSSLSSRGIGASAWVDLLDAQSKINPADFHARVAAAGARDYGEDVADRNIALSAGVEPARPSMLSRNSSFQGSVSGDREVSFHLRRLATSQEATRSLSRSSSLRRDPPGTEEPERPLSRREVSHDPEYVRLSPFSPIDGGFDRSGSVTRARSVSGSRHELRRSDQPVLPRGRQSMHGSMMYAASSNDLAARVRPASLRRGISSDSRHRPQTSSGSNDFGPLPEVPKINLAARRVRSSTLDSTASVPPSRDSASSIPAPIRTLPKTFADFDFRPMSSGSEHSRHRAPSFNATDWANSYRLGRIEIESVADLSDSAGSPAPSPFIRRGDAGPSLSSYDRARSQPRGRSRLDEIAEAVPIRGSSLRHSSISSATPTTTSSVWSGPTPRPHSLHTTQTSIDLPQSPVTVIKHDMSPTHERSPSFNMDDYLSEEDEDEIPDAPKRRRSPEDEGLLFNDSGYGFRGMQLPGLFDAIPEFPSEELPLTQPISPTHIFRRSMVGSQRSQRSTSSAASGRSEEFHSIASKSRPASRALADGDEQQQQQQGRSGEYEDVLTRARSLREEKNGLVPADIKRAIRMRKESKARLRERKTEYVAAEEELPVPSL